MSLYTLENITKSYKKIEVLNIENLELSPHEIIGFFGPNGSGKSTLFSLLAFLNEPNSGVLKYRKISSKKLSFKQKQSVVLVPQNPYLLKRSVYDNVAYGLKIRNLNQNVKKNVKEALDLVGLDESFCARKTSELSGGEAQRVALASRLILRPEVLILDEPTTGVDVNSAQLIKESILNAKQQFGTSILISSHDHNWLNHICDKKIALYNGKIVESGNINLLFAPWKKDENNNLVKEFLDGQKLILANTKDKKRDSVALISSDDIHFCKSSQHALKVTITSISLQNKTEVLVVLDIGGIVLNKKITQQYLQENKLYPGLDVYIYIDTDCIYWL